jgi:hypothetical protein
MPARAGCFCLVAFVAVYAAHRRHTGAAGRLFFWILPCWRRPELMTWAGLRSEIWPPVFKAVSGGAVSRRSPTAPLQQVLGRRLCRRPWRPPGGGAGGGGGGGICAALCSCAAFNTAPTSAPYYSPPPLPKPGLRLVRNYLPLHGAPGSIAGC